MLLRLKTVIPAQRIALSSKEPGPTQLFLGYSRKSSTFAPGKCGEICLLATTLKNAKKFHIVFLVSLHVFRIRWSFLFPPSCQFRTTGKALAIRKPDRDDDSNEL